MLLVVSVGLFLYNVGPQQSITGYVINLDVKEGSQAAVAVFTLFSILLSFSALTVSLNIPGNEKIKQLMSNVSVALNNNETTAARMMYVKLRNSFNKLPKDDKKKHRADCMQLYQRLVNQLMVK
ncbi:hypothetical protein KY331_04870 [Candidatus Woesearchaeota archaeon]|nr:hypothetical protein [Candidatus Woesearchaeota archaeon]